MNPTYRSGKQEESVREAKEDGGESILDRNDPDERSAEQSRRRVVLHEANPAWQAEPLRQNRQPHGDDDNSDSRAHHHHNNHENKPHSRKRRARPADEEDDRRNSTSRKERRRHRNHHHRRAERRELHQDLRTMQSLEQQRAEFQSLHDSIHRDNLLVASLIATLYRMRSEPDPLIQWLLAQHVLYETHQYTLKLLQDEVFGHLRRELEAEHPRTRLLQRWILPDDEPDDNQQPHEWTLDWLLDRLRGLPVNQLIWLLRPPSPPGQET